MKRDVEEFKRLIIISFTGTPSEAHIAAATLAMMGVKVEAPVRYFYN